MNFFIEVELVILNGIELLKSNYWSSTSCFLMKFQLRAYWNDSLECICVRFSFWKNMLSDLRLLQNKSYSINICFQNYRTLCKYCFWNQLDPQTNYQNIRIYVFSLTISLLVKLVACSVVNTSRIMLINNPYGFQSYLTYFSIGFMVIQSTIISWSFLIFFSKFFLISRFLDLDMHSLSERLYISISSELLYSSINYILQSIEYKL